jgi:uncharacterized protein (DUF58 family)
MPVKRMTVKLIPVYFWKRSYWQQFFRVATTTNQTAVLNPRRIYIIPTRWGLLYGVMLIALLVGSINYSLSLGYYVTFLLASLGNIAMLHTWRNLVYLQIEVLHAKPVFAGDLAQVTLKISDNKNRPRYNITASFADNIITQEDVTANAAQAFELALATQKRGYHSVPRIALYTEFPLSLFHAWAYVDNPFQVLVYAKPSDNNSLQPESIDAGAKGSSNLRNGDDDFYGHKSYQMGDSPSRVDWKASSRGVGMLTKQYSGTGQSTLWLDWAATDGDKEARISLLTKWVIEANAADQTYGLKLPASRIEPSSSDAHYHQCLRALALI